MIITKCDLCKKVIGGEGKKEEEISVSTNGIFSRLVFCAKCGEPVKKFLKSKKLIKE